jgi:ferredoxin
MTLQRLLQILNLTLFGVLLALAVHPLVAWLPHAIFLQLDPAAALLTGLASRTWIAGFGAALLLWAATVLLGRFFCGYVCPLGTVIDGVDCWIGDCHGRAAGKPPLTRAGKFYLLAFLVGAALFGISFAHLAAPIPLVTRLIGLLVLPLVQGLADLGLAALAPLAQRLNWPQLLYLQVPTPRYDLQWVTLALVLLILVGRRWAPRFWCRNLCPAGALFALGARRPLLRRRVSEDCIDCGLCVRRCPMAAIGPDPRQTDYGECTTCQTCRRVCPTRAVSFPFHSEPRPAPPPEFAVQRRALLRAGLYGCGTAAVTLSGARHLVGDFGTRQIVPVNLIRPPGSRPEAAFLSRCLRCGACQRACPTNTLQPMGLTAGLPGLLTPVVTPQLGPCEPSCNACGPVCPTGAIRILAPAERLWAKIGTAQILRHKCLAWEFDRKCLVCDEVCPYDAVVFRAVPEHKVIVPFVTENRCSGCGFCEHHCPVEARPAIVVEPMEALRLNAGSYRAQARAIGLDIRLRARGSGAYPSLPPPETPAGSLPPGFSD